MAVPHESNSLFVSLRIAQQRLEKQKRDVELLEIGGVKGVVAKKVQQRKDQQQAQANEFWFGDSASKSQVPQNAYIAPCAHCMEICMICFLK